MEHEHLSTERLLGDGWDAPVGRLDIADSVRFLQLLSPCKGDYTAERQQKPSTETLDEIVARIRARQQRTEPASTR